MQKRIDEIQSKYREWCELLPRNWKQISPAGNMLQALMQDMDEFYTNEYQACHQAIEEGADVDLPHRARIQHYERRCPMERTGGDFINWLGNTCAQV